VQGVRAAVRFEHVDIAQVGEGRVVGDHAHEADLRVVGCINADAERAGEGAGDGLARNADGPVTAGQIRVDGVDIEPGGIVGDEVSGMMGFVRHEGEERSGSASLPCRNGKPFRYIRANAAA